MTATRPGGEGPPDVQPQPHGEWADLGLRRLREEERNQEDQKLTVTRDLTPVKAGTVRQAPPVQTMPLFWLPPKT